ncbi:hypothetical protein [Peribacillus sp. SCS-155]|uniref:hypothetical protein n=1 Tax=Peribacillus sedimenti TaxID=3115297 RepID=UPI003906CF2E
MKKKLIGITAAFLLAAGTGAATASAELPSIYSTKKGSSSTTNELPSIYSTTVTPGVTTQELPSIY